MLLQITVKFFYAVEIILSLRVTPPLHVIILSLLLLLCVS